MEVCGLKKGNLGRFLCKSLFFPIIVLFLTVPAYAASSYLRIGSISENLTAPTAVAVDANENVYVAESSTNTLFVFNGSGAAMRKITGLDKPVSVAVDKAGSVYVGNAGRGNVEVYGLNSSSSKATKLGSGDGEFILPSAIAVDNAGLIYVSDIRENVVKIFASNGAAKGKLGSASQFTSPASMAIDKASGDIFVCDSPLVNMKEGLTATARVQVFDKNGKFKRSFGTYGQGEGMLTRAMGVAVDSVGRVYVTDAYQNVVQMFDSYGKSLGAMYSKESPFRTPMGIAVSSGNKSFVASLNTGKVEVYYLSSSVN